MDFSPISKDKYDKAVLSFVLEAGLLRGFITNDEYRTLTMPKEARAKIARQHVHEGQM